MTTITRDETPTATARFKQQDERPVYWLDWRTDRRSASEILAALARTGTPGPKIVYILSGATNDTAPPHAWYRAPVADGYTVEYRSEQPPLRVAKYTKGEQAEITFRHTSTWFRSETNLDRVRSAYRVLSHCLRRDWWHEGGAQSHVFPLASPAQTGLDLAARLLPRPSDYPKSPAYRYPIPAPDLWQSLHTYGYQHRSELCADPVFYQSPMQGYWYLDGRFAYAAHTRNVPCWLAIHDHRNRFEPDRWGWYHITATVPSNWRHLGIFKTPGRQEWPHTPGARIDTWADQHEIKLALAHGWDVKVHERYVYNESRGGSDPLRHWTRRLVDRYSDAAKGEERSAFGPLAPLLKEAYGHILYDTLGTFKRSTVEEVVDVPRGQALPLGAHSIEATPHGWQAHISRPLSSYQLAWAQVHWWVAITSRQRNYGLMRRVLQTPREQVGAIRTDAAHLFCAMPDRAIVWHDYGKVGDYRVKGHLKGPVLMPQDETGLFDLMQRASDEIEGAV